MCGIVGYAGKREAAEILLEGLSRLEYRGYDSAGIAVFSDSGKINVKKASGRLGVLYDLTDGGKSVNGKTGIGHTRWATHGAPSEKNAHPHFSDGMNVVAVHNGIIENYIELKEELSRLGYSFYGDTDTEVAVKLIDHYYKTSNREPVTALSRSMKRLRGSYALAVMFGDIDGKIYALRKDSPMIVGVSHGETFLSSDVPAILKHTKNVFYVGDLEIVCIEAGSAAFYNADGKAVTKSPTEISWNAADAEKDGFDHFMQKEIFEQPRVIADTLNSLIKRDAYPHIDVSHVGLEDEYVESISKITVVACGSAYHVGVNFQYVMEDIARIPVRVEYASEFRYRHPLLQKNDLVIIISQSGETADSLAALRESKKLGARTLAVVNVVGSSIAREADNVIYTIAGPEIAVATTKAYSAQLAVGYVLAVHFAKVRGVIDEKTCASYIKSLLALPEKTQETIKCRARIKDIAEKFSNIRSVFFIGRGIDSAIALEGSLKLKEISYIHSEAYAAGELKHGTISLVDKGTLVVGLLSQSGLFEKTLANMLECKARGAYLFGIASQKRADIESSVDIAELIPDADEHFIGSLEVIPLQLFAYYISAAKGLDVDKPRNLAKSVTVE